MAWALDALARGSWPEATPDGAACLLRQRQETLCEAQPAPGSLLAWAGGSEAARQPRVEARGGIKETSAPPRLKSALPAVWVGPGNARGGTRG
eukprot:5484809-Alexandrium_andersonii.AAC.1